ncbi:MAG: hypothetical protein ACI8PT_002998, partial [Gammaproteobacteria bacterium]
GTLPVDPWVIAISGTLVASALSVLYWSAPIQIKDVQPRKTD